MIPPKGVSGGPLLEPPNKRMQPTSASESGSLDRHPPMAGGTGTWVMHGRASRLQLMRRPLDSETSHT